MKLKMQIKKGGEQHGEYGEYLLHMESSTDDFGWWVAVFSPKGTFYMSQNIDEDFLPEGTFTPLLEEEEPEFEPVVDIIEELPGMYLEEDEHTGDVIIKMESNVPNGQDWNVMIFDSQGHYDVCTNIDEPFLPNGYFVRDVYFERVNRS